MFLPVPFLGTGEGGPVPHGHWPGVLCRMLCGLRPYFIPNLLSLRELAGAAPHTAAEGPDETLAHRAGVRCGSAP